MIGGGLLGLEAANALVQLGLETHVVEMAPRLMPVQLDGAGGSTLVRHIEKLGVSVHAGVLTEAITGDDSVAGLRLRPVGTEEGHETSTIDAQVVVFSAGIRPRDALARECDLDVAERGGVLVDEQCRTSDAHDLRDRRVRGPRRQDVRPGRTRLRDGRGRRRRPPRRARLLHRRRHVDQAQAARRRRRQLR